MSDFPSPKAVPSWALWIGGIGLWIVALTLTIRSRSKDPDNTTQSITPITRQIPFTERTWTVGFKIQPGYVGRNAENINTSYTVTMTRMDDVVWTFTMEYGNFEKKTTYFNWDRSVNKFGV